jgi:hypothetical protein
VRCTRCWKLAWERSGARISSGQQIDAELTAQSMPVLLKYQADIEQAMKKLGGAVR